MNQVKQISCSKLEFRQKTITLKWLCGVVTQYQQILKYDNLWQFIQSLWCTVLCQKYSATNDIPINFSAFPQILELSYVWTNDSIFIKLHKN